MPIIYEQALPLFSLLLLLCTKYVLLRVLSAAPLLSEAAGGREIETSGLHAALFYIALHARLAYLPSSTFVPTHVRTHILQVKLKKEFLGGP